MTDKHPSPAPAGLNLGDIYHVLFRHKWKILTIWTIGIIAAASLWFAWPVKYESHAELLVRYVMDTRSLIPVNGGDIQTPGGRGGGIIGSEMAILQSFDLAKEVAQTIGPSNILAKVGGGTNLNAAAAVIRKGLTVDSGKDSAVILAAFQHPDPTIVQPVLTQIIASYLVKHAEVHQSAGTLDEVLTRQTDQLRTELQQTEQELRDVQAKAGIISLDDSKKAYTEQMARIRESLFAAEAELAARQASLTEMTNMMPVSAETNLVVQNSTTPPEKLAEYKRVNGLLENLRKVEQDRLLQFTPESPRLKEVQNQIAENQKVKDKLEQEFPQLLNTPTAEKTGPGDPLVSRRDIWSQMAQIREIKSKIDVLNQQMAQVRKEAAAISEVEGRLTELQRKRDRLEQNYMHFAASLNNAQFDENLSAGRIQNISTVESPTPPAPSVTKAKKIVSMVLFGSLAAGLALAFAIELYLDRSFKRPIEIENKLHVPLFLSIPHAKLNGNRLLTGGPTHGTANGADPASAPAPYPWKQDPAMCTYFETLRDRLILFFEANNLTHKPKLVAVTGCAPGTGVSTVATGLAASLSETGDGNVLLVDMNELERGAAAFFHKGQLECGLDEALEKNGSRESALVHDNLYVVTENPNNQNLPRILHKRFADLMPKLRASDYDYIIFDMPPVSQISPTSRLARFMDMVFMVVEAEKTDRDVVKRATDMLVKSKANVGIVLNKKRTYVPKALQQEL